MNRQGMSLLRWAAAATLTVALGVVGVSVGHAAISSGERTSFAPIEPCRLFDTRPLTQVGSRGLPLGPGETWSTAVRDRNGNCTIPADAVAVAMNVTVVNGTAASFLTVWPGGPRPNASSLNWVGGAPPTPNKVDVRLDSNGSMSLFNLDGKVDVIADITGYYADHNHDDRYYTKAEMDARVPTSVTVGHSAFVDGPNTEFIDGCTRRTNIAGVLEASVPLPAGVIVTDFDAYMTDSDAASNATAELVRRTYPTATPITVASTTSSGFNLFPIKVSATLLTPSLVIAGDDFFVRFSPGPSFNISVCSITVHYHLPG